ncbi:MAG: hypothetical protein ACREWG_15155 [Gammaproteobacteria bacterium]
MRNTLNKSITGAVLASILMLPNAQAGIKCWQSKDGVRECGNAVPPEYAQQGYTTVNTQGVQVGTQVRSKTVEELRDGRRQAEIKAEEERKLAEQNRLDQVLLATFSSEDDMVFARDGKVSSLEGQIKVAESQIGKLEAELDRMIAFAAAIERNSQKPQDKLVGDIASARKQIEDQRKYIEAKRAEQEAVREQFETNVDRFRRLTAKR